MELRELAEQILFATSLDHKLRCPDVITDDHPGSPVVTPRQPGRPADLHFKPTGTGTKADFPGLQQLENQEHRGRLLHFFANHELLATELMALVLLKFPDAPKAFRKGVLQTLRDEQEHTRRYMERMQSCGIQFGQLPVSGYFWRAISDMEHPMDYVAGLSLTFEQANLDFCRHFAAGFHAVGDSDSAALLDQIHRDEIVHVAYGLKWFRKWKNPRESDWDAYCRQLRFPLSPSRAKGAPLNMEGRRAAGLDEDFIQRLNVHSQSKGRTPHVFWFNPLSEARMALGASFTPVKAQAQLVRDLSNLPQFIARQDDLVLVEKAPSIEFLSGCKAVGLPLPEFVETVQGAIPTSHSIRERKLGALRPWAWGPDSIQLFQPLFARVAADPISPSAIYNDSIQKLYSKTWSAGFLQRFLQTESRSNTPPLWACDLDSIGTTASTWDEVAEAIQRIRGRGHHRVVVKKALGLAGQNAIRLWEPHLLENQERWIRKALEQGIELVVEPWQERLLDFSIQLEMEKGRLRVCGYTGLINDERGQFQANWAGPQFAKRFPLQITQALTGCDPAGNDFAAFYHRLFAMLESELAVMNFRGPLGIDSFLYRVPDVSGQGSGSGTIRVRVKPVVEINPRYTMGRLLVELMQYVSPGSYGIYRLINRSQLRELGFDSFRAYAAASAAQHPVQLKGDPKSFIQEGCLCLNDPATAEAVLAVLKVSRHAPVFGDSTQDIRPVRACPEPVEGFAANRRRGDKNVPVPSVPRKS